VEAAPRIAEVLDPASLAHFERVQAGLDALGIPFTLEPGLVRGLDYYTHTLFEFQSLALDSAQSTIIGGGRYDGPIEQPGGPPTPGIGFGSGIERMLLACDAEGAFPGPATVLDAFVVDTSGGAAARDLSHELRRAGLRTDRAFEGRSMKAQMKAAAAPARGWRSSWATRSAPRAPPPCGTWPPASRRSCPATRSSTGSASCWRPKAR